ncbi:MAG: histidine kinase [Cyclobacteriaceae bacterium]
MKTTTKTVLYWACQLIGWGTYILALLYFSLRYNTDPTITSRVIILQVIIGIIAMLTSHSIRAIIRRYNWLDLEIKKLVPRITISVIIGAIAAILLIHVLMIVLLDWQNTVRPINWSELPMYTGNLVMLLSVWSILYVNYQSLENARRAKIEKLEAKAALKDAELIALKAQINPHFLFNSLNNIRALVLEDQMKAREMITNLSDLMRYSIEFNKQEKVTISEEIEIAKNYLQLESIQYDNRLSYKINVHPDCLGFVVPPMIIQTMVENAIKHGISQVKDGGRISIQIHQDHGDLKIEVSNTGNLQSGKSGTGIGIKNALERIKILLEREAQFDLTQKENIVTANLIIPSKS